MEKFDIKNDIKVFGFQVKSFPNNVDEAFNTLMQSIKNDKERNYYGVSYMEGDAIVYKAFAEEKSEGEASRYNYETYTIEKGEYYTITLKNWRNNTSSIKDIFSEMMKDEQTDNSKPCIEWYKTNDEMLCMMKAIN